MTITEETVESYKPLTSETRVEDLIIPTHLELGGQLVALPKSITRKDPHFLINAEGLPVRAAWISQPLAHILNSKRLFDIEVRYNELQRALKATEECIAGLVKYGVLRDKHGPGAMALCQANENVPKDSIVISARTFDTLCLKNPKWKTVSTVMGIRFPNLGPGTTQELKLIVNKAKGLDLLESNLPSTAIGSRINLKDFLHSIAMDTYEDIVNDDGVIDAFYLHPETLKDGMEGDGDGDQIFIVAEKYHNPRVRLIDLQRSPKEINQSEVDMLFSKASRTERTNLETWLPPYFDDVPIGPATYAIRWILYNQLKNYKNTEHPMHEAWKAVSSKAIQMIEFVMDIRKGDWTDKEIEIKMLEIQGKMKEIQEAQKQGDWFAKTVTSNSIEDVSNFVMKFRSLQDYVNLITMQRTIEGDLGGK